MNQMIVKIKQFDIMCTSASYNTCLCIPGIVHTMVMRVWKQIGYSCENSIKNLKGKFSPLDILSICHVNF